jgi:hypothetical protein
MSVCMPVAQCVRLPCFSTYASRRQTVSVRPLRITSPVAMASSPSAAASRLILNSTVSTPASAGNSVKPA